MRKALYKIFVKLPGEKLPHIFQFTNENAAWDFYNTARVLPGVESVTRDDWPTTLYSNSDKALADLSLRIMR